jgi:hypothetical protein
MDMGTKRTSPGTIRWTCLTAAVLLATGPIWPATAQTPRNGDQVVTATITIGTRDGAARPDRHGQSATVGGDIDISQPAPDTLVVRMSGNVAACGSLLAGANAAIDFFENLQFAVEFSQPGHSGKLVITSTVNGLLSAKGKHSTVGMSDANVSIGCGPNPIVSIPIPARSAACGESIALNTSQGPICAPIYAGCYNLRQSFTIFAIQKAGLTCGKAIAEFSPSALSSSWIGSSYPFQQVDQTGFGYKVTIRVVPDPN